MATWDRQPGEASKAYSHFTVYRDLGPGRTLARTGEIQRLKLPTLEELSAEWNWVERCDQWDAHLRYIHDRALLTEAAKAGRERAKAFTKLLSTAEEALGLIDLEKANLAQVAAAMKAATEGLRVEEGLATQIVTTELQDARIILSRLPPEIRTEILRALGEHVDAARRRELVGGVPGRSPHEE